MTEIEKRDLYYVVGKVESDFNPYAFRFEPHFSARIEDDDIAVRRAKKHYYAYSQSLKAFLSFSVCRIQVLVYNLFFYDKLYDFALSVGKLPSVPYVLNEAQEFDLFKLLLDELGIDYNPFENEQSLKAFAIRYNGSPAYAYRLYRVAKRLGYELPFALA